MILIVSILIALVTPTFIALCWSGCEYSYLPTGLWLLLPSELWLAWLHWLTPVLILGKVVLFYSLFRFLEKCELSIRTKTLCLVGLISLYIFVPTGLHLYLNWKTEWIRQLPGRNLVQAYKEISNDSTKSQVINILEKYELNAYSRDIGNRSYLLLDYNMAACFTDCLYISDPVLDNNMLGYCFFQEQLVMKLGSVTGKSIYYDPELGEKSLALLPKCRGSYNQSCIQDKRGGETVEDILSKCDIAN